MTDLELDPTEQAMHDVLRGLAKRLVLLLGVLAIGLALGLHLGLGVLQQAAMAAGAWPTPYATAEPMSYPLYAGARQLQLLTNLSAGIGAVLLLVYGLMDRYGGSMDPEDYPEGTFE